MVTATVEVRDTRTVGPQTIALDLETPKGFEGLPGQFVLVRVEINDNEESGYFTISSPDVEDTFEVTVKVDPDGDVSPWLANRERGDTITIEGPYGNIAYNDEGDVTTIASGPGIGPALAIAERAHETGHDTTVIYQNEEWIHKDRLSKLQEIGHTVNFVDEGAHDELSDRISKALDIGDIYIFGFEGFCEVAVEAIEAAGGDPDAAYVESFG